MDQKLQQVKEGGRWRSHTEPWKGDIHARGHMTKLEHQVEKPTCLQYKGMDSAKEKSRQALDNI